MFEPEKKTLTFFYSKNLKKKIIPKTSTLLENIAENYKNDWQVYITISLGLVHTKNNSTQRLKLKPKTFYAMFRGFSAASPCRMSPSYHIFT